MPNQNGKEVAQGVLTKMAEFREVCEGLDEESSSRAPEGRWSPKQIISHLCGPEGIGHLPMLKSFLELDTPEIDLEPEKNYWSERRRGMGLAELLSEFDREYSGIATFIGRLSEEQLLRRAHIPIFKNRPLGEYPTLAQLTIGLSNYHIGFHIDHMREIMQVLGLPGKKNQMS